MREKYTTSSVLARSGDALIYTFALSTMSAASPSGVFTGTALEVMLTCLCMILVCVIVILFAVRPLVRERVAVSAVDTTAAELIASAPDAILVISAAGQIREANPAAERLFGYALAEIEGKSVTSFIPPPSQGPRPANYILDPAATGLTLIRRSGDRVPVAITSSQLSGNRHCLVLRPVPPSAAPKDDLVSAIVDQLPVLLVVTDIDGRIVRFNRAAEDLTQFSEGEIRGQHLWRAIVAPESMAVAEAQFLALREAGFPSRSETTWCLRDNSLRTIAWSHAGLFDDFGRLSHIVSAGADITHSLVAEERRREVEALSTAGRLASGIAHDFNNLLTAITGYSGLALGYLPTGDPIRHDIEEIQRASDKGASLTRQLLAFSGNHPRFARPIDCNEAVRNIERLLRVMTGDRIQLDLSLESTLPLVLADMQLIEECVMHLVANAKEAMPNGGTLQVQTGLRTLDRTRLDARPPLGPGEYVTISVVDTGAGIPPEALPHIFEPFFTTKDSPIGNGMGLAMVYGIVRQAEGSIVVHSAPKFGSTFRIFLPLAPSQPERVRPVKSDEPGLQGDETVLIAMDNDADRERLRDVLESAGYHVLEADSAPRAVEIAQSAPGNIHLLISDIVLPRMSGPALAAAFQRDLPHSRTLFATSRDAAAIEREGLQPQSVLRLDRTFDRRFVLLRVREALAAASPR